MTSAIKCFMLTPTSRAACYLRRCGEHYFHNAMVRIEDGEVEADYNDCGWSTPAEPPHDDPRWPTECDDCGSYFQESDLWELFYRRIYLTPDGTECAIGPLHKGIAPAPAGSMFFTDWKSKGADGRCLSVIVPGGANCVHTWAVDAPLHDGRRPTRTGTPPNVSVDLPYKSLHPDWWGGWLRNGYLIANDS